MIIPVIMCGGAGTRLWPASRGDNPKPFLPLVDGASTFALTLQRIAVPSLFGPRGRDRRRRPCPSRRRGAGRSRRDRHHAARAGRARYRRGNRRRRRLRRRHAPRGHPPGSRRRSRHPRSCRLPWHRARPRFRRRRPARSSSSASRRHGRPPATATSSPARSWPVPAPAPSQRFVEKPDAERARQLHRRRLSVEQRHLPVARLAWRWPSSAPTRRRLPRRRMPPSPPARPPKAARSSTSTGRPSPPRRRSRSTTPSWRRRTNAAVTDARFDWSDLGTWGAVWDADTRDAAGNVAVGDAVLVDATEQLRQHEPAQGRRRRPQRCRGRRHRRCGSGRLARARRPGEGADRGHRGCSRKPFTAILPATTAPGATTSRSTRAGAIRSSASSSSPAPACRCRSTSTAPSTGRSSKASPRSPSAWSATRLM